MNARRAALIAGLLAACFAFALFMVREVPDRVLSLVGGPNGGVARHGGARLRFVPPPGVAIDEVTAGLASARVSREGSVIVIELPGVEREQLSLVEDVLVQGGLQMRPALRTDYAVQIQRFDDQVLVDPPSRDEDRGEHVWLDLDYWHVEDTGGANRTFYLRARTADAIDAAITRARANGWQPAPGYEILVEHVKAWNPGSPEWYRTYAVEKRVVIGGAAIANAVGDFEPNSGRPVVLMDLDREGTDRFCEATRELVGEKLATVLGDRVWSAPVINSAICGGRVSIDMGGSDLRAQVAERDALIAVLQVGAFPRGGAIDESRWFPRPDVSVYEWLGRGVLALMSGFLLGLATLLVVRISRPHRAASSDSGNWPTKRILVTALVPFALPIIDQVELGNLDWFEIRTGRIDNHVDALGFTPVFLAFILVELVALAVPPLHRWRLEPLGRVRLGQVVAVLAILLALGEAWLMMANYESVGATHDDSLRARTLDTLTLVGGTCVLVALAGVIREHGLGNGYGILFIAEWLFRMFDADFVHPSDGSQLLDIVSVVVIAISVAFVVRWRTGESRLHAPIGGAVALFVVPILSLLITVGWQLGSEFAVELSFRFTRTSMLTWIAVTIALVPVFAWLFARPGLLRGVAERAGAPPITASWSRALPVALLLLAPITVVIFTLQPIGNEVARTFSPFVAVIAGGVIADVIAEARARRTPLEPAWVFHQIQHAGAIEYALTAAKIPCHFHASHLRALLGFFGPFAPVVVLVPAEHAVEARLITARLFER